MGLRALFTSEPEPLPAGVTAIGVRYYEQWLAAVAAEGDADAAAAADRWHESGAVSRKGYDLCVRWHRVQVQRVVEAGMADCKAKRASDEEWEQARQHAVALATEFEAFARWGSRVRESKA